MVELGPAEALMKPMIMVVTNNNTGIPGAMGRYQRPLGPFERPTTIGLAGARLVVDLGARASVVGC